MTNLEKILALGNLIIPVLTYFAGMQHTKWHLNTDDKNKRINQVLEKYLSFRRTNMTGGFDGLKRAGIATLKNNEEVHELIQLIVDHGERHPLGKDRAVFEGVDLLRFFKYATKNNTNFHNTTPEQIIEAINSGA